MNYQEYTPGLRLMPYVKCYYVYESEMEVPFEDTVFPSGHIEIIFNLGTGSWQTAPHDTFITTPSIELWGQITRPLLVRSVGRNTMLGVRLFPHAAALLLQDKVDQYNNQVADLSEVTGTPVKTLHQQLLHTPSRRKAIGLVEAFLTARLIGHSKKQDKLSLVSHVMQEIVQPGFFDNIDNVAARYGITARYLQKLFLQYTGLTPKLYSKINRFQSSLRLVNRQGSSLTAIAYDCGYFDQSHFIREFKSFTGYTPTGYSTEPSPLTQALSA